MADMKTILIVDDDDFFRDRLGRAFVRRGYEVFQAGNFDEAVPLIKEHLPRLAVFDLKMPGRNGLMLVEEAIGIKEAMQIVVLTGYGSIATATDAIKLGAMSYLAKPADVNEIIKAFDKDEVAGADLDDGDLEPPSLARMEWEHIQRVLHDCDGNISTAAKKLGLHRRTLQRKLNKVAPE
jgi:two-component system, response regulator RegA